ncbi:hypothetical protein ACNVD5_02555, partial [Klebsiella pneumoniae]
VTIYPGISADVVRNFLRQPVKALILRSYGVGNAPQNGEFIQVLAEARATRKGIEIVRQQRKDAARLAGDHIGYMHWDSVSCDELAAGMTG